MIPIRPGTRPPGETDAPITMTGPTRREPDRPILYGVRVHVPDEHTRETLDEPDANAKNAKTPELHGRKRPGMGIGEVLPAKDGKRTRTLVID